MSRCAFLGGAAAGGAVVWASAGPHALNGSDLTEPNLSDLARKLCHQVSAAAIPVGLPLAKALKTLARHCKVSILSL